MVGFKKRQIQKGDQRFNKLKRIKKETSMREIALNILDPDEIVRLRAVLNEVVLALPEQNRSCEIQASVAEQLLKLAAEGEKDPIRLKEHALRRIVADEPRGRQK
jgi:hypothetical protein